MIDIEVKHPLLQFTKKEVEEILAQFNRTLDNVQVDVDGLKGWIDSQPHLAHTPEDIVLLNFLILNKFSIEKTKSKLDYYYSVRALIPEIFRDLVPSNKEIIAMRQIQHCFPLPKLVNLNRVVFCVASKVDFKFNGYKCIARAVMYAEGLFLYDIHRSLEVVLDFKQTNLFFWSNFTPVMTKNLITISEKMFSHRINAIRFIGLPSFAQTVISYAISLFPQKIQERVSFYKTPEEIAQVYPIEQLPPEYGGTGRPFREMSAEYDDTVDQFEEYFQHIQNFKIDEGLRPTPLDNDEMLGFHGNFRKLEVD